VIGQRQRVPGIVHEGSGVADQARANGHRIGH
jgi:hypothetical protein